MNNDYFREKEIKDKHGRVVKRKRFSSTYSPVFWTANMNSIVSFELGKHYDSLGFFYSGYKNGEEAVYVCAIHKDITNETLKNVMDKMHPPESGHNFEETYKELKKIQKKSRLKLWPLVSRGLRDQYKKEKE